MPDDANGVYSLPPGYLAITGQTILPSQHNPPLEDVGTALSNRLSRNGSAPMTGALKLADGTVGAPSLAFNTAQTNGLFKSTNGIGVSISGTMVAEFGPAGILSGVTTASIPDKAVAKRKLFKPSAAKRLLGSDAEGTLTITGAANNGSGLIRLQMASTSAFSTGEEKTVFDVVGTTEANNTWIITVVDGTHIDLQGSAFTNAYVSGGTIGGAVDEISLGSGLTMSGKVLDTAISPTSLIGYLSGLELSTPGSSATFSVAAGSASDRAGGGMITLAAAISKTTSAWTVGNNNGGLDTGTISANTWYHAFAIKRTDTGVVEALVSLSATAPTLPANYTLFRRIGSMKTNGSAQWIAFVQFGDDFLWLAPPQDIASTSLGASPTNFALGGVPTGVKVLAQLSGFFADATNGVLLLIQSPDATGAGPNGATGLVTARVLTANVGNVFIITVRTDTSARVVAYSGGVNSTLNVSTRGWTDFRGK